MKKYILTVGIICVIIIGTIVLGQHTLSPQKVTGKDRVSSTPYLYDITEGIVPDHFPLIKFGFNSSVGTSKETVWSLGGIYTYMAVAETLKVFSADDDDSTGGTGARTLHIYGLDANYNEQDEVVNLSGNDEVATASKYLRIFRAIVRSAGTSLENEGAIYIKDDSDTDTLLVVNIGTNQTLMALWTVPRNFTFFLTSLTISESGVKSTKVYIAVKPFGEVFQLKYCEEFNQTTLSIPFSVPLKVEEMSDIEIRAISVGAGGSVGAVFDGWYELN